ncbi:MAG TPA: hypothetical protein DD979_00170 [Gammaproteobacteria bacterium]|nr:hypothetical protein [Gammaproteobacteria bacterium]
MREGRHHKRRLSMLLRSACMACVFSGAGLSFAQSGGQGAASEDVRLSIKPSRCVALHEGQICYQNITITWRTAFPGNYCVYWEVAPQPLQCWENTRSGRFEFDFQSAASVQFSLRPLGQSALAITPMRVAWVHRARQRKRLNWRLF